MAGLCRAGRGQIVSTFSGHRPDERKRLRPRKEIPVAGCDLAEESVFVFSPFSINDEEKKVIKLITNGRFTPIFRHQSVESSVVNTRVLLKLIATYPLGSVFIRVEEGYLLRLMEELYLELDEQGWAVHFVAWRGSMIAGIYTYYGAIGYLNHTWWNPDTGEAYPHPVRLVTHRLLV